MAEDQAPSLSHIKDIELDRWQELESFSLLITPFKNLQSCLLISILLFLFIGSCDCFLYAKYMVYRRFALNIFKILFWFHLCAKYGTVSIPAVRVPESFVNQNFIPQSYLSKPRPQLLARPKLKVAAQLKSSRMLLALSRV